MLGTYALVQATPAHIYKSFPPEHKAKALSVTVKEKTIPAVPAAEAPAPVAPVQAEEPAPPPVVEPTPPASGSCGDWLAQAGIPATNSVTALIGGESGCRPTAQNPSGACGIAQELPCGKSGCATFDTNGYFVTVDPVCQLGWMNSYVIGRYGSWDNAYATWLSRHPHWY